MQSKKLPLSVFCLLSLLTITLVASEIPRQFRVWGRKAPAKLGAVNPRPNQYGLDSISIPRELKKILPDTNLLEPEIPASLQGLSFLAFPTNPMRYTYDVTRPFSEEIGRPVRTFATPGEYASLAFAIRSLEPLACVQIDISALSNEQGEVVVPRNHIDLRIVRDLPIRPSTEKTYLLAPRYLESFDEFDVLMLPTERTERFWLTIKVPDDAPAGIAKGKIAISCRIGGQYTLDLAIRVLPFKLAVPDPEKDFNFQILCRTNDSRRTTYGRHCDPNEIQRLFVDMAEHGMNSSNYEALTPAHQQQPDGSFSFDFDKSGGAGFYSINDYLHLLLRSGISGPVCLYNGPYGWSKFGAVKFGEIGSPPYNAYLQAVIRAVEEQRQKMSWPEFIYFIGDEPGANAERLRLNMNCGQQVKAVNPKLRISNFFNGQWGGTKDWKILKEVSDINCTNFINEETLSESPAIGYESVWGYNGCYNYPTDTRGYRVFYGFHPWKCGLKGITQYVSRAFPVDDPKTDGCVAYDQINNCNGGTAQPYDFTYPSAEGPLPTPKWESIRQGINDYRYLLTLKQLIASHSLPAKVASAQAVLDEVMENYQRNYQSHEHYRIIELYSPESMDVHRWKIARAIMELL